MSRIVVFDSGLGSLTIIKAIQKICRCEIIYFADQKNFPYGKKSKSELSKIIKNTIKELDRRFHPDLIVVGSNTPTLMLGIDGNKVIGVNPPLKNAAAVSKTKSIGILSTKTLIESKELDDYILKCKLPDDILITKINSSPLVELVETGSFLSKRQHCKIIILNTLKEIACNNIDACTLSSTHLPFLRPLIESIFPKTKFIDPAEDVALMISSKLNQTRNCLKIYSSGNIKEFESNLRALGIRNKVTYLSF